ncbi:MAG: pimeloyl-ACP methyl ester carboxylesterase [Flavobacteriales bacterium]|jgi:pimeloyl-ACP methyl ester carboxylesterase
MSAHFFAPPSPSYEPTLRSSACRLATTALLLLLLPLGGCGDDPAGDDVDTEDACDESLTPIVLVHGFLASGDTWASFGQRFAANGWCADAIIPYDWDSLDRAADPIPALDSLIDAALARTGATQVWLAGHSAGGGVGYDYLSDDTRAGKVGAYAHIGSFVQEAPAGAPTLHLYSTDDRTVTEQGDIPGATNVALSGVDHYGVATSAAAFATVFEHFTGALPAVTDVPSSAVRLVSGRALALGTNTPVPNTTVNIWRLDAVTGARLQAEPDVALQTDAAGYWGDFQAEEGAHYAFRILDPETPDVPVTYYFEPFSRTNAWVYLRTLPPPGTIAGLLLSVLPLNGDSAVHVNFTRSTGVIAGVDSLTVNGIELLSEDTASPDDTTIAMFLFDDGDGESSAAASGALAAFPFLAGADVAVPAGDVIEVRYNDRVLRARALSPAEGGVTITVFD